MGLLLQLFVVTTLVAVLHSAPLAENSESTTVGIRPLPAVLSKNDESKESDEDKAEIKRVSRETPPRVQTENQNSQSTTTNKPETGSRPVRDVPAKIGSESTPSSTQRPLNQGIPSTETRKVRSPQEPKAPPPHPPPPPPPPPSALCAVDPPHNVAPPPPPPAHNPGYPDTRPPTAVRPVRDTDHTPGPQVRPATLPARIDEKTGNIQKNDPQSRHVRDTDHTPKPQIRPATLPARIGEKTGNIQKNDPQSRHVRDTDHTPRPEVKPVTLPARINERPTEVPASRNVRDIRHPQPQTRPAPLPGRVDHNQGRQGNQGYQGHQGHQVPQGHQGQQQNHPGNRHIRDIDDPRTSSTTEKTEH